MKKLTQIQEQVFDFVCDSTKQHGFPPTVREISTHFKKSTGNTHQHLHLIERKGYIRLTPTKARGIEILKQTQPARDTAQVPLIGTIAAGEPITAIEHHEGYITLDKDLFRGTGLFTLRVQGDSMQDIGIMDGDIAVIRQQQTAENSDIVAIIINDESATLKRYIHSKGTVVLHAENKNYADIEISLSRDNVRIVGKLIGIMRTV